MGFPPADTGRSGGVDWSIFGSEALRLLAATFLGAVIGVERQIHQKNAGVRTHALVGLGAALFTVVGIHPWLLAHIPSSGDAMRVAAQVVAGIGFLGAGVIFVNRDAVRGLTTAAAIWVSAAIGMACGAGMIPLAGVAAALYLVTLLGLSPLVARIPGRDRRLLVRITYLDRAGTLRRILTTATQMEFESAVLSTHPVVGSQPPLVEVTARFRGGLPLRDLVAEISEIQGVHSAELTEDSESPED